MTRTFWPALFLPSIKSQMPDAILGRVNAGQSGDGAGPILPQPLL